MRLSTQIGAALLLLLVVVAGLAVWQLVLINRLHQANRQLADVDLEVSRSSLSIRSEVERLSDLTERFFVLRDAAYRAELRRIRALVDADLQHLQQLDVTPEVRGPLQVLLRQWEVYSERATELEALIPNAREPSGARGELLRAIESLRSGVESMDLAAAERAAASIRSSTARAAAARRAALLVGICGVVLVALLVAWIRRSTILPLQNLATGAHAIAAGELEHRVPVRGPLEIQSLAEDFNSMAERLAELDRVKQDFLSTVSHDLKAPLAAMQETSRLMLDDEDADRHHLLELNLRSGERLQGMIDDLLEVARLEAGGVEFDYQVIELVDLCRRVLSEAEGLIQAGRLGTETDWPDQPTPVYADVGFLQQALWNLVSNAVKFSPEGGVVRLSVHLLNEERLPLAEIRVIDQGPGIPDPDKPHVFERFFRSRRHERFASGTGLGLAIARTVVEQMGGSIRVEDRSGGGSVFVVLLPIVNQEAGTTATDGDQA